ncbi:MAG: HAD family hydrolase [Treponema sp.]|nr:HAD family hydrolase [Treponema sp.]
MKIYRIPENLQTIIFDIDSTLYTNTAYAFEQVDVQVRHFAELRGITADKARAMVTSYRKEWALKHGGQKISLGNTLTAFGVTIEDSIEWRKKLLDPALFLKYDEQLIPVLKALKEKYRLICVTNNPVLPARKTLEAIGIADIIPDIIGLDTCHKSKPAKEPFLLAAKKTDTANENCLSIGDRYDMDISLPLELGMGGILVTGVTDIYTLPSFLSTGTF